MKTITLIIAIFILSFFQPVKSQILTKPVAHYTFDSNVTDSSPNANNGTVSGTITPCEDRNGNKCGAMQFDGASYIEVPTSNSLEKISNRFTVTGWINFDSNCNNNFFWATILCKGEDVSETDSNPQFRLQFTKKTYSLKSNMDGKKGVVVWDMSSYLSHDTWHFFAATSNGSEIKMYLDGTEVYSRSINLQFLKNSASLYIGRDIPGSDEFFCGKLDDIRIFDKSLSTRQIEKIYNYTTPAKPCPGQNTCNFPDDISGNIINYTNDDYKTKRKKMMVFALDNVDKKNTIYINFNGTWMPDPIELTENKRYVFEGFLKKKCNYILFKSASGNAKFDIKIDRKAYSNVECSENLYYGIKILYEK